MPYMYKGSATNGLVFKDEKKGGYFYAYSNQLSTKTYTEVFANIVLPTQLKLTATMPRNAYLCLGIHGDSKGVDIGLGNWGNGWCPFYQDTKDFSYGQLFSDYVAPSNATNALIVAKPVSNSQVHLYVQFQDANGNNVGKTFDRTLTVGARSGAWNRYYRFASLVPRANNAVSNDSDETYMIGAKFTNSGIYNGSSYSRWGTTGSPSLCEVAWVEGFPKAKLVNNVATGEEVRIDHWA